MLGTGFGTARKLGVSWQGAVLTSETLYRYTGESNQQLAAAAASGRHIRITRPHHLPSKHHWHRTMLPFWISGGDELASRLLAAEFGSFRRLDGETGAIHSSRTTMSSETTTGWGVDATTSNMTDLFDNATSFTNVTQAPGGGGANTILAEETIKIIYLIIG